MARRTKGMLFKRGQTWYLEYYANGKRFKQSLRTGNEEKAKQERERILRPVLAGQTVERLRAVAHALSDAEADRAAAIEENRQKLTLAGSWEAYLRVPSRPDSGPATLRQYGFQWQAFVSWVKGAHADCKCLRDVTPALVAEYAAHLRERGLSAGTFNKHVALGRLVCDSLAEAEGLTVNPFAKIARRRDAQHHRKELPWDKLKEVCDAAQGEMKLLLFLGIYTGQRLGDCCRLSWDEVDLMRGWIIITPSKTRSRGGEPLHIPIHPHLRPLLEATPEEQRKGPVLPELAALYERHRDNVTDRVQRLLRHCGISIHQADTGPKTQRRAVLQYGFHSLRHTTVTLLQEAGVPQAVVQRIVGHRTVAMTNRYTHVGRQAISEAMAKLPSLDRAALTAGGEARAEAKRLLDTAPDGVVERVLKLLKRAKG